MRLLLLAFLAASVALATEACAADGASRIVGTWRVTAFSALTVETGEVSRPYGEHPIGYIQYSPGGHVLVFLQAGEVKRDVTLPYSDAVRAEIHRGIFGAYAGTYSVDGNKVIHHVKAAWRPEWVGDDQVRFVELHDNKLTIKTAPLLSGLSGKKIVSTLEFERAE